MTQLIVVNSFLGKKYYVNNIKVSQDAFNDFFEGETWNVTTDNTSGAEETIYNKA